MYCLVKEGNQTWSLMSQNSGQKLKELIYSFDESAYVRVAIRKAGDYFSDDEYHDGYKNGKELIESGGIQFIELTQEQGEMIQELFGFTSNESYPTIKIAFYKDYKKIALIKIEIGYDIEYFK